MITRLKGILLECDLTSIVVDVNGVGYAVAVPMSTYDKLPRPGSEVVVHTWLHVRDDALQLFGFSTPEERQLFLLLQTVTGIGPKLALNILSNMPLALFCQAIVTADIKALSKINGVGKRTAERLVLELKDKITEIAPTGLAGPAGSGNRTALSRDGLDAVAALGTLGFKADAAQKVIIQLCGQLPPSEQKPENLIRKALQLLNS